ncbi:MAG: MBL fold metallo-hydrolase [Oligoflexia bacterium]|nr:MBL fold metallo-hydrolase [Oligoflexia bacterium]
MKIVTIDCDYLRPRFAASYLVHDQEQALFVDNNTAHSVPLLLEALKKEGMRPEQVKYLIITHVHLDHAGGSSALMRACPNAILLGHPRAIPHMIDPSRLVASARRVYGEAAFEKLYGTIEPIAAARTRIVEDGERLAFGKDHLRFIFTRGHANHHMCTVLEDERAIFTGDSFGLAYPDLQKNGLYIFPSTSPTDFDAKEAKKAIQAILTSGAKTAYPTHYGAVSDMAGAAKQLNSMIDFSDDLLAQSATIPPEQWPRFFETQLRSRMGADLALHGMTLTGDTAELLKLDIELNAAGLAHIAAKRKP